MSIGPTAHSPQPPGEDQVSAGLIGPPGTFQLAGIMFPRNFQNLLQFGIQTGINGAANETQPCDPRPAASPSSSPKYLVCRMLKQSLAIQADGLARVRCWISCVTFFRFSPRP